jgi:hypothetical protein
VVSRGRVALLFQSSLVISLGRRNDCSSITAPVCRPTFYSHFTLGSCFGGVLGAGYSLPPADFFHDAFSDRAVDPGAIDQPEGQGEAMTNEQRISVQSNPTLRSDVSGLAQPAFIGS